MKNVVGSVTKTMTEYEKFWLEVKDKIDRFNRIDNSADIVFGARGHKYRIYPTMTVQEIDKIESEHKLSLPAEFKAYLLYFGAGGAGPGYGVENFRSIFEKFSTDKAFTPPNIDEYGDREPIKNFSGLAYFGTNGCAADNYLELVGSSVGTVWVTWSSGDSCSNYGNFIEFYSNWITRAEKTIIDVADK